MHKNFCCAALLATVSSLSFAAEDNMRAGLWEIQTSSDLVSLAQQIPPDQMRNLGELARQYGIQMPQIKNGAALSTVCVTQEMSQQKIPPYVLHPQSGCEARNAVRTGNRYSADLACSGEKISGQGKTSATLTSPEHFNGSTEFKGLVGGVPIDERAISEGRWIAAQCAVKNIQ
jgi:hypothetical protein